MTARITPYEALLEPLETVSWPHIREEAAHRGADTRRRDEFVLLGAVGATLRDVIPDDAPADAVDEYAELIYHAYHYWAFGKRTYVLNRQVLDQLLAPEYSLGAWTVAGPPSCYLQLPAQRIWARVTSDAPFEPIDGCFVVVEDTAAGPDAAMQLHAMLVLGLRPERPGISLVGYRAELDPHRAAERADLPWRGDAPPFANAIPGGERQAFHAIVTESELEAFVLRTLQYLDLHSDRLIAHEPKSGDDRSSALPYIEVRQHG